MRDRIRDRLHNLMYRQHIESLTYDTYAIIRESVDAHVQDVCSSPWNEVWDELYVWAVDMPVHA